MKPVARKQRGLSERNGKRIADAFEIAPHVMPLGRIDIEGRVIPTLGLENRSKQKWTPNDRNARPPRDVFDAQSGRVGIAAGKLEPELDGFHDSD